MDLNKFQGGWFKRASKMMLHRRLPFAPLDVDGGFAESGQLEEKLAELRSLSEMASDKEAFLTALNDAEAAFLGAYQRDGEPHPPELPARSDHLERFVRVMEP